MSELDEALDGLRAARGITTSLAIGLLVWGVLFGALLALGRA